MINNLPSFSFAFFDASQNCIEEFLNAFSKKKKHKTIIIKEQKNVDVVLEEFRCLEESKAKLIELRKYPSIAFFYNPLSDVQKTIMISNLSDGWYTLCNVISIELNCEYYLFQSSDDNVYELSSSFTYVRNGSLERCVYSMKEGKWVFYSEGNLLPFEESQYYEQKMIKKRLTKQILIEYCKALGLFIEEEEFWKSTEESLYFKMGV